MRFRRLITPLVAAPVALGLSFLGVGVAQAAPLVAPSLPGAVSDVALSSTTLVPGHDINLTYRFNSADAARLHEIQVWLGHSTGMGHGFTTELTEVRASCDAARFVVPAVAPSGPRNIWSVDLVWNHNGIETELSSTPVTIH